MVKKPKLNKIPGKKQKPTKLSGAISLGSKYMVKKPKLNKIPGKKTKRGQTKLSGAILGVLFTR
jgi:hypothetical protein